MRAELVYQRELSGIGGDAPEWCWPVVLADGRVILTLLYRSVAVVGASVLRTVILELDAEGNAKVWGPGVGYATGAIFYVNERGELFGLDLARLGKVYVCLADGTHRWTLESSVRMDCAVGPRSFRQVGERVFWRTAEGVLMRGDVAGGTVANVEAAEEEEWEDGEVRLPYVHVTKGNLFVFEFGVGGRVSRYRLGE